MADASSLTGASDVSLPEKNHFVQRDLSQDSCGGPNLTIPGGVLILARVRPSDEDDFTQIMLPVALSYETFLCKLAVALRVEISSVRKCLKLPDILIKSTEDVLRLQNWDKLEIRLKRANPLRSGFQKISDLGRPYMVGFLVLLCFAVLLHQREQDNKQIGNLLAGIRSDLETVRLKLSPLQNEEAVHTTEKFESDLTAKFGALESLFNQRFSSMEKAWAAFLQRLKEKKSSSGYKKCDTTD